MAAVAAAGGSRRTRLRYIAERRGFLATLLISPAVLFILWILVVTLYDKQVYMVFTPGQFRVRQEIGEGEMAYHASGVTFQRRGAREHRDERRGQRAFREQVTQQVGYAKGDGERVHDAPAAKQRREDLLAREAEHAAAEHREPDDARGPGVQPLGAAVRCGRCRCFA